jgi:hypothetical protein
MMSRDVGRAQDLPENQGVVSYVGQGVEPRSVSVARPPEHVDTYRLGAHPDVVERLWTQLNGELPDDARYLVADTAALVHSRTGLVLAVALGTAYAIRLEGAALQEALSDGFGTVHEFTTVGRTLDLAATFGAGWVFGRFDEREGSWLRASLEARSNL